MFIFGLLCMSIRRNTYIKTLENSTIRFPILWTWKKCSYVLRKKCVQKNFYIWYAYHMNPPNFAREMSYECKITYIKTYTLMSVRLWNFKDGGSLNTRFLPKNQHAQRISFLNNPMMNDGLSKSAKIVLPKSIFHVKNQQNFFKETIFCKKPFFSNFNF